MLCLHVTHTASSSSPEDSVLLPADRVPQRQHPHTVHGKLDQVVLEALRGPGGGGGHSGSSSSVSKGSIVAQQHPDKDHGRHDQVVLSAQGGGGDSDSSSWGEGHSGSKGKHTASASQGALQPQ
jgi:hypothetical protein